MTDAEITALIEENATLKKQVSDKDDVIAKLNDELTRLLNKVFGHTSEKHLPFDPAQLLLFDQKEMSESERAALEADVKKAEDTITYTVTRKAKPSRKPLDDSKLEVVETHIFRMALVTRPASSNLNMSRSAPRRPELLKGLQPAYS